MRPIDPTWFPVRQCSSIFLLSLNGRWEARGKTATVVLGRVCKRLQPEQDHADVDHGEIVVATLLIPHSDAPCLLEAVDQPLDFVAQAIGLSIEVALARLVFPGRDHRANVASTQAGAGGWAAVTRTMDKG